MTTATTEVKDAVQEIVERARQLSLSERLPRPEAAWRVLGEEFPNLAGTERRLAHIGLVFRLGVTNHESNAKAARNGGAPAVNQSRHLQIANAVATEAQVRAFIDECTFVGAEGFDIRLGDGRYDDLDLRYQAETAQAVSRATLAEAFRDLRDAVGKDKRVRDLPENVLAPLVRVLRAAM